MCSSQLDETADDSIYDKQYFFSEGKSFQSSSDKGHTNFLDSGTKLNDLRNNELMDCSFSSKSNSFTEEDLSFIFGKNKETEADSDEGSEIYYITEYKRKRDKFMIIKKGKRGRKRLKSKNIKDKVAVHGKDRLDNLLSKIQVHFLSFITSLSNDALKTVYGKNTTLKFFKISYDLKKKVKNDFFNKIKDYTIKDILLKFKISDKYKRSDKNNNISLLHKACEESEWLNNFFNKRYLDIFKEYYYKSKEQPISEIKFMNKKINLSEAKSCYYLLSKDNSLKNKLIETIKNNYLNNTNGWVEQKPFITSKNEKETLIELKEK